MITIDLIASLETRARSLFGPLPYGEPIPEPPLEPGKKVTYHSNGSAREAVISKVHFDHHNGKLKWDCYDNGSPKPLDLPTNIESHWPEGGVKPAFAKGDPVYVIPEFGDPFLGIVMAQTSLDPRADVYVTDQGKSRLYFTTKRALLAMQDQYRLSQGSPAKSHDTQVGHKLTA